MTESLDEPGTKAAFRWDGDEGESRSIAVTELLTPAESLRLLRLLKERHQSFALYDPLYPSPSDPGAYFSYSPESEVEGMWQMTLGNHGWSGGIYRIGEQTLCLQLSNLASKQHLRAIEIERVAFYSHYDLMLGSKNDEMNQRLLGIHG